MQIELVYNPADFARLESDWDGLCAELPAASSAFTSFSWYQTWWRHYAGTAKLQIVTLREDGKLVGIAPLMQKRVTLHGLPAMALGFIENNLSLNNDFIVHPRIRERFLGELLRYLRDRRDWDVLVFRNMPESSENRRRLLDLFARSRTKSLQNSTWFDSPYLVPSGSWEEYLASRSARTRKTLRNIANSMEKAGDVQVRQIQRWEDFLAIRDELFEVTRQSWAASSGDPFSSTDSEDFFQDLTEVAAEKGWLSLWTLQLDGKIIAIEYHLRAFGKEHAMRGHYLPEFASLSPGTYLETQILRHVFTEQERVTLYDFGGSFENYKRKWTGSCLPHHDLLAFNHRFYARLLAFHEMTAVPLLRSLLPQDFWNSRFFRMCGVNTRRLGDG